MQALHCIDLAGVPRELRESVPDLIRAVLTAGAIMSEIARALVPILLFVAGLACGRFGGAWWDGSYITRTDADLIAQGRVEQATKAAVEIQRAIDAKNSALRQLGAVRPPVSLACPPGTGAVSQEAYERYLAK